MGTWVSTFEKWRATLEEKDNRSLIETITREGAAPKVTKPEGRRDCQVDFHHHAIARKRYKREEAIGEGGL